MLAPQAKATVPAGTRGSELLASASGEVPPRGDGRENRHRERSCILALLRHLMRQAPNVFPASLERLQAPDFLLCPSLAARPLAIEHTDAAAPSFFARFDAEAGRPANGVAVLGGQDGWHSGQAEPAWRCDIQDAIRRKAAPKFWRNAPAESERWLLLYDLGETGPLVSDAAAVGVLNELLDVHRSGDNRLDAVALVRGAGRVLLVSTIITGPMS